MQPLRAAAGFKGADVEVDAVEAWLAIDIHIGNPLQTEVSGNIDAGIHGRTVIEDTEAIRSQARCLVHGSGTRRVVVVIVSII